MKTTLFILFISFIGINSLKAQDTLRVSHPSDSVQSPYVNEKGEKIRFNGHVAGIYAGFIHFIQTDYSAYKEKDFMKLKITHSYTLALNLIEINIGLQKIKNNIGIVAGIGAEFQNMELDHKISVQKEKSGRTAPLTPTEGKIKSSRLMLATANIPVMLEFQMPSRVKSRFHIAFGTVCSYNFFSQTKIKLVEDQFPHPVKTMKSTQSINLSRFKFDLMAQVGGNHFAVWSRYGLTPLFKKDKGPELHQLSFGASILF